MKQVDIECTGYVPMRRPGETTQAAHRRVGQYLWTATHYLIHSDRTGLAEIRRLFDITRHPTEREARMVLGDHFGRVAAFHRLVLSPHPTLGLEDAFAMERWSRQLLLQTRQRTSRDLVWVAAIHGDTHLWHTHLLLAGADRRGADVWMRMPLVHWMEEYGSVLGRG